MDIERGFLEVIFKKIPYEEIQMVDEKKDHKIKRDTFCRYADGVFPQYTDNERQNIFDDFEKEINKDSGRGLFHFIAKVSNKFLTYNGRDVLCKYEQILRWRDISFQLGQDLFTMAYLAKQDYDFGKTTHFFAWSPIIKTDNRRLHSILDRGTAENHFHLGGSTQLFMLNWLCLMNHISDRSKDFKKLKEYLDNNDSNKINGVSRNSLYRDCMIAAYIRLYLFSKTHGEMFYDNENKKLEDVDSRYVGKLQRAINEFQFYYASKCGYGYLDYAYEKSIAEQNDNDNRLLVGERKFLYDCFRNIFENKLSEKEVNYFLIYLKIKQKFRNELVQTNERIGFHNFCLYQDRKEYFIEDFPKYQHELIRLAINSTLREQNIVSLEARICPKSSLGKNIKAIKENDFHAKIKDSVDDIDIDEFFEKRKNPKKSVKSVDVKHFYVLHFPKIPETNEFKYDVERNVKLRKNTAIQTKALIELLESEQSIKYRVRGIDACTHEINCRPEVFGEAFRYLTNVNIHKKDSLIIEDMPIVMNATYHAGEDFLDIADGLRAIDEAMLFCGLKRGSRLGHALALGLDVPSYYKLKNKKLILYKHDIMDNIVWLVGKAAQYNVCISSALKSKLEEKFNELYNEIYDNIIEDTITMWDYYNAWKLRGDNPKLYLLSEAEFKARVENTPILQSEFYKLNGAVPNNLRLNRKSKQLYYNFHYSKNVREKGNVNDIFEVDDEYVKLVQAIQKKMQFDIARQGIAIECNPSSNYLISVIQRYDNHPIVKLNNSMLTYDNEELRQCPQISVSVNTDDQGVFDTFLENEYALLALALEKCKDENGKEKYSPAMVYDWIDHIRQLGLEQAF